MNIPLRPQPCSKCPNRATALIAGPANVRLEEDGETWALQPEGTAVHIAALFRDPGIKDRRRVEVVLDLHLDSRNRLRAGRDCWLSAFLTALRGLPPGFTVALDNGVRCPCPIASDSEDRAGYRQRAEHCHEATVHWHANLSHPDGKPPAVVLCDKDLADSLASLGLLTDRAGRLWRCPTPFVDAVGDLVAYLGGEAMILAHPAVFLYDHAARYLEAFAQKQVVRRLVTLARWNPLPG